MASTDGRLTSYTRLDTGAAGSVYRQCQVRDCVFNHVIDFPGLPG